MIKAYIVLHKFQIRGVIATVTEGHHILYLLNFNFLLFTCLTVSNNTTDLAAVLGALAIIAAACEYMNYLD